MVNLEQAHEPPRVGVSETAMKVGCDVDIGPTASRRPANRSTAFCMAAGVEMGRIRSVALYLKAVSPWLVRRSRTELT